MPRIATVEITNANPEAKTFLEGITAKFGKVPNFFGTIAQAPNVAAGYSVFNGKLAEARLSLAEREAVALAQAAFHGCPYCSAAHTAIATGGGVAAKDATDFLNARAEDTKTQAVIDFALAVLKQRGSVAQVDIDAFRAAGHDDGHIVEVIGVIAVNTFTNFVNLVANTEVDFPPVALPAPQGEKVA